jgi:peptidylprolyl isomerase
MANIKHISIAIGVSVLLMVGIGWWVDSKTTLPDTTLSDVSELTAPLTPEELAINNPDVTNTMNPVAVFTTNKGVIKLELFEDKMPITVGNFTKLASEGFYNGTKFHRIIDGFMIQGGDPNTKGDNVASYGTGGPEKTIQDEFVADPLLSNVRGTISMANTGQPNSGGSQFFINTVDNLGLDFDKEPLTSRHPVFGRVIDGMDVVDAISNVETGARDLPVTPVVIESLTIERTDSAS